MLQMLCVFAEFERSMIRERVMAGLSWAKADGFSSPFHRELDIIGLDFTPARNHGPVSILRVPLEILARQLAGMDKVANLRMGESKSAAFSGLHGPRTDWLLLESLSVREITLLASLGSPSTGFPIQDVPGRRSQRNRCPPPHAVEIEPRLQ
jgi:Resolvase, N terminal domain